METETDASSSTSLELLKNRTELWIISQELSLDSKTANKYLSVSRTRAVKLETEHYSVNPERFDDCFQVLSKKPLVGCSYWEVKRSGRCSVAVASKDISRTG
ncbi:hypothetical protein XENOCAPTIV_014592 [Xenoophorus captivus]|uniref:SPRY-associated domain-containing protein n=1 Tax=Xenoophorus captivus TaxID=1517983 RepID=A0ABV0RYR3_9TELE